MQSTDLPAHASCLPHPAAILPLPSRWCPRRSLDIEEQERARNLLPSSWGLRAPIDQARKALDRLSATLATAESELSAVRQRVQALEGTAHRDMDEASRLLAV